MFNFVFSKILSKLAPLARVGLMDADIYGPNIPIRLGIPREKRPEGNAEEKIVPLVAHGVKTISIGFFANPEQPVIWRGPLLYKTLEQFLHRVDWGELDFLVVDLPPRGPEMFNCLCRSGYICQEQSW